MKPRRRNSPRSDHRGLGAAVAGAAGAGKGRARGFSKLELLVVMALLALLAGILLPAVSRVRSASRSTACLSNLRQIALGFQMYAHDHGAFPNPAFTELPWERSLAAYLPVETFRCPSDGELAPATGSSYDWRDTGIRQTTLAGRNPSEVARPNVVLAFDALPSWHEPGRMNVATVDGSVRSMDQAKCVRDLETPVRTGP